MTNNQLTENDLTNMDYWKCIDFSSLESIASYGFEGPVKIGDWRAGEKRDSLDGMGVYLIARPCNFTVQFLEKSTGGTYQLREPTVSLEELKHNWIEDACVLYIGKAGGAKQVKTLSRRLSEYVDFGHGKSKPHSGGRYIWQLGDSDELLIYWLALDSHEPAAVERALINNFEENYKKLPFANLI